MITSLRKHLLAYLAVVFARLAIARFAGISVQGIDRIIVAASNRFLDPSLLEAWLEDGVALVRDSIKALLDEMYTEETASMIMEGQLPRAHSLEPVGQSTEDFFVTDEDGNLVVDSDGMVAVRGYTADGQDLINEAKEASRKRPVMVGSNDGYDRFETLGGHVSMDRVRPALDYEELGERVPMAEEGDLEIEQPTGITTYTEDGWIIHPDGSVEFDDGR